MSSKGVMTWQSSPGHVFRPFIVFWLTVHGLIMSINWMYSIVHFEVLSHKVLSCFSCLSMYEYIHKKPNNCRIKYCFSTILHLWPFISQYEHLPMVEYNPFQSVTIKSKYIKTKKITFFNLFILNLFDGPNYFTSK